jgi:hypothetical protein
LNGTDLSEITDDTGNADNTVTAGHDWHRRRGRGVMANAVRRCRFAMLACAVCLTAAGCVYRGGQSQTLDESGTPVGVTALSVSLPKLVAPPPPPAGFSSTYQKMLTDRQRLARQEALRDARMKTSETNPKDKVDSVSPNAAADVPKSSVVGS